MTPLTDRELEAVEELASYQGQTVELSPDLCALLARAACELRVYREALAGLRSHMALLVDRVPDRSTMTLAVEDPWLARARVLLAPKENDA